MSLSGQLARWVSAGLITAEQSAAIATHEQARRTQGRARWVLYAFLVLGALVMGIGVISLVAANWEAIPGPVKLGATFAALGGLGWALTVVAQRQRPLVFDALAVFFLALCLATVGLIAQVYHSGGRPWQGLGFGLVLVAPLAALGKHRVLPQLWVLGLLVCGLVFAFDEQSLWWHTFAGRDHENLLALFVLLPLGCLLAGGLAGRRAYLRRYDEAFTLWAYLGGLVALVATDVLVSAGAEVSALAMAPVWALALGAGASLWLRPGLARPARLVLVALMSVTLLAWLPLVAGGSDSLLGDELAQACGALYGALALGLLAVHAAQREWR